MHAPPIPPRGSKMTDTTLNLTVQGMSCDHCRVAITDEVERVAGVESVEIDMHAKLVTVRGTALDENAVVAAVDEAGYDAVRA
jgi:copper chaperone